MLVERRSASLPTAETSSEKNSLTFEEILLAIQEGRIYPAGSKGKLPIAQRAKLNYVIANKFLESERLFQFVFSNICTVRGIQSQRLKINAREVGRSVAQGHRETMEDADVVQSFQVHCKNETVRTEIYGVFDGHGGAGVANFLKDHMVSFLSKGFEAYDQLDDEGIWKVLKESFLSLNKVCDQEGGSTAAVALVIKDKLWVANVGDSRVVLNRGGIPLGLTEDALPDSERYKRKVEKRGSVVLSVPFYSGFYVDCQYGMARSFGNKRCKGMSAAPKITFLPLGELEGQQLIVASDGLFEVSSSKQVVEGVEQIRNESAGEISMRLVDSALSSGSQDNVTVLVVKF